jgi:murein DD-endopeptidase MepM/ murein hydrolase activator NlpD
VPIGTPVYVPKRAGCCTRVRPAASGRRSTSSTRDETITLYGHVNRFLVTAGELVPTGQQIAEVGSKGQSTGPHLHVEVHTGGLYSNRVNPMPWPASRGISLGGGLRGDRPLN